MSLRPTSLTLHASTSAMSPGQSAGSMLSPYTRRRTRPLSRKASAIRAERSVLSISGQAAIVDETSGMLSGKLAIRGPTRGSLPTSKCQGFKNLLIAERRLSIRPFTAAYGFGRFGFAGTWLFTHIVGKAASTTRKWRMLCSVLHRSITVPGQADALRLVVRLTILNARNYLSARERRRFEDSLMAKRRFLIEFPGLPRRLLLLASVRNPLLVHDIG